MEFSSNPSLSDVTALLSICSLPVDDLEPGWLPHFHVARDGQATLGVVGLQLLGSTGLLRSLGVTPAARCRGVGARLVEQAERHASGSGVARLYLLTNDAREYFKRLGYTELARENAPPEIRATSQFRSGCCASAVLMEKELES